MTEGLSQDSEPVSCPLVGTVPVEGRAPEGATRVEHTARDSGLLHGIPPREAR